VIAKRMVDAKASGLATRLESLPARIFSLPEAIRPTAVIRELGQLHLLAEAYRRQNESDDLLSSGLKASVRQTIGWSLTREALLADSDALRVKATWRVIAALSEVQADRLRRLETWLWREGGGEGPHFALLIDFVPVSTGAVSSGFGVGDRVQAELVFYPGAVPLRAQIAQSSSGAAFSDEALELPEQGLNEAYRGYEQAMLREPWLDTWVLSARNVRVRRHGERLFLCDSDENAASLVLPLKTPQSLFASPLLSIDKLDAVGLWDGYSFTLCWAQTELGRWASA